MPSDWIPILGTLAGTALGAGLTHLFNSLNQGRAEREALSQRNRSRLEEAYKLLIQIDADYRDMWSQAVQKLKLKIDFKPYKGEGLHPIHRLEMLVRLYYATDLAEDFAAYEEAQKNLGTILTTIATEQKTKYSSDELLGIVTEGYDRLASKIKLLQKKIAETIEA